MCVSVWVCEWGTYSVDSEDPLDDGEEQVEQTHTNHSVEQRAQSGPGGQKPFHTSDVRSTSSQRKKESLKTHKDPDDNNSFSLNMSKVYEGETGKIKAQTGRKCWI